MKEDTIKLDRRKALALTAGAMAAGSLPAPAIAANTKVSGRVRYA